VSDQDQINSLSNENLKLKTKNMNLEKEIVRLQKIVEEDPQKNKLGSSKDIKVRTTESTSLKIALRNLQKELDDLKK
jgi:predicted RNase H-like nuclease (RuvC/YqgF family)